MLRTLGRLILCLFLLVLIAFGATFSRSEWLTDLTSPSTIAQQRVAKAQSESLTYFGSLEVSKSRAITPGVSGEVLEVLVEVGDLVEKGQQLLRLDTAQLDWSVQQAVIDLELARVALLDSSEQSSESELMVAEANLELARTNLAKLEAGGAAEEEIAAAHARANAAWANYNEILAGPSEARLQQLHAEVERAQLSVTQAQRAYNEVAWRDDVGSTAQAANLHRATIDLNVAQAAYAEATQPARTSEVQSALAAAHQAQHELNELENGVSEVDLAVARAQVAAEAAAVLRIKEATHSQNAAELRVSQALISLEEAQRKREKAQMPAPFTGIVLALNVVEGQMISAGSIVGEIGDASGLELMVLIPQDQVVSMSVGDPVRITRFGSDDITVMSTVSKISPISLPGKSNSTFPVTIQLPEDGTAQFKPGIFVSATFE